MLNYIWLGMVLTAVLVGGLLGNLGGEDGVVEGAISMAKFAVVSLAMSSLVMASPMVAALVAPDSRRASQKKDARGVKKLHACKQRGHRSSIFPMSQSPSHGFLDASSNRPPTPSPRRSATNQTASS